MPAHTVAVVVVVVFVGWTVETKAGPEEISRAAKVR